MVVPVGDLLALARSRPEVLKSLRDWVTAGGRLVLSDCGPNCASVQEVESIWFDSQSGALRSRWYRTSQEELEAFLLGSNIPQHVVDDGQDEWQTFNGYSQAPSGQILSNPFSLGKVSFLSIRERATRLKPEFSLHDFGQEVGHGQVVIADFGGGRIAGLSSPASEWDREDWGTILVGSVLGSGLPLLADGFGPEIELDFPDIGMPGIGQPPWALFAALITFFTIGIGPVAYTVLHLRKKIPWMLGLVPLVAVLLTVGLLVFAILSEGLGTKAVRTSQTWIDQDTGRAFTRTWCAIYSGLSPGSYVFDRDTVPFQNTTSRYDSQIRGDGQRLRVSGGQIRARTIHQLAMARVDDVSQQKMAIQRPVADGGSWTVTNQLGTDASPLIVNTGTEWLYAENLSDGQSVSLMPVTRAELLSKLTGQCQKPGTSLSEATELSGVFLDPMSAMSGGYANAYYYAMNRTNDWGARPDLWTPTAAGRGAHQIVDSIRPESWWALTTESEYAARPASGIQYLHQLHIVHGNW